MSDASTTQSVECPICGDEFDPTVAGGWCTNTECGEWQYTEGSTESDTTDTADEADDGFASPAADEGDSESVGLFEGADEAHTDEADGDVEATAEDEPVDDTAADEDTEKAETDGAVEESADADDPLEDEAAEGSDEESVESAAVSEDAEEAAAEAVNESEADDAPDAAVEAADAEAVEAPVAEANGEDDGEDTEATIDCPDCGAELEAAANFCVECGTDVSDVSPGEDAELDACPGCGADVEPEDNFCVNCGEDLDAHRGGDAEDHDDAIDALEAGADEDGTASVPESLVLEVEGHEIHVDDGDTVGREIRAALTEAGRPDDEAVRIHREHVRFVRESDGFYLLDLGDNPTQLNGRTLRKGDREPVAPGDELELSGVASVTVQAP